MAEHAESEVEARVRAGLTELVAVGPDPTDRHLEIDAAIEARRARLESRRRFLAGAAVTSVAAGSGAVWLATRGPGRTRLTAAPTPPASEPGTGGWRPIPAAPLTERGNPMVVWADDELIVWGGIPPGGAVWPDSVAKSQPAGSAETLPTDGAAWSRKTGEWRSIDSAPVPPGLGFAVWNGSEVLVGATLPDADAPWNRDAVLRRSGDAALPRTGIAAYQPNADRWRYVGPAEVGDDGGPRQAVLLPDGSLLVAPLFGSPDGPPRGPGPLRVDPATGELLKLTVGPFRASTNTNHTVELAVVGEMVVATPSWDRRPWVYEPGTDSWQEASPLPDDGVANLLPATAIGDEAIFTANGSTAYWAFDPRVSGSGAWRSLPPNPHPEPAWRFAPVWSGRECFVPGAAFEPKSGRWREISHPPRRTDRRRTFEARWAGDSLLVFGGEEYTCPDGTEGGCTHERRPDSLDGWILSEP